MGENWKREFPRLSPENTVKAANTLHTSNQKVGRLRRRKKIQLWAEVIREYDGRVDSCQGGSPSNTC